MTVWLVKVMSAHVQGNGYDDVTFQHTHIDSVWTTQPRAEEAAANVRKNWKEDNVHWLEDVEVEAHEVQE